MITIIVSHLHIKNENISFCSSLNIIITKFLNTHSSILGTCVSIHHGKYKENHLLTLYMQYTKFLYSVLHHLYKTMLWQNPHMPIVGNIVPSFLSDFIYCTDPLYMHSNVLVVSLHINFLWKIISDYLLTSNFINCQLEVKK